MGTSIDAAHVNADCPLAPSIATWVIVPCVCDARLIRDVNIKYFLGKGALRKVKIYLHYKGVTTTRSDREKKRT